jgi:hypothetical protein
MNNDTKLIEEFLTPIRICADYKPAFGHSDSQGIDLTTFQDLYGSDPFYAWLGLNDPLVYAAHKAAGGLTSVYRQIGVGTERLLRAIIRDSLGLDEKQTTWSYDYAKPDGKKGIHILDARVSLDDLDASRKVVFADWISSMCPVIGMNPAKRKRIKGVVFEIRQGYKSADSKRQNADLRFGMSAYQEGLLPAFIILSRQVSETVIGRYKNNNMAVLTGTLAEDPLSSTFAFFKHAVGYDLAAFFTRNTAELKAEVLKIIHVLLTPEQK